MEEAVIVDEDDWPEPEESVCTGCGDEISIFKGSKPLCFPCHCKERGCTIIQKGMFHNRHYHCGHCESSDATSYQGHYGMSDDGRWGFSCEDYA